MDTTKCAHEPCRCSGTEIRHDGYCSDSCRDGLVADEAGCACNHPACRE